MLSPSAIVQTDKRSTAWKGTVQILQGKVTGNVGAHIGLIEFVLYFCLFFVTFTFALNLVVVASSYNETWSEQK